MKTKLFFLAIALMFCAIPMFAQGAAAGTSGGGNMIRFKEKVDAVAD